MANSKVHRAIIGLPILALSLACNYSFDWEALGDGVVKAMTAGRMTWGGIDLPIVQEFYYMDFLNQLWVPAAVAFGPTTFAVDHVAWYQMFSFLLDVSLFYTIWIIESYNPANAWTPAYLPLLFAVPFQLNGIGVIGPIYLYLYYINSTPKTLSASSHRVASSYTSFIVITMVICSYIPIFLMHFGQTLEIRYWWTLVWQMFPVWASLCLPLLYIIPFGKNPKTARTDSSNLPLMVLIGISAVAWIYVNVASPYSMRTLFWPWLCDEAQKADEIFPGVMREFIQLDQVFSYGATFLCMLYLTHDLKKEGLLEKSWISILTMGLLVFVVSGPGCVVALGWLGREKILRRDEKMA